MPVPFGFSIGDFITGIGFLVKAVKSLNDTHGARADYQELGRELSNLSIALDGIQTLSWSISQASQIAAIDTVVDDCRSCIVDFVKRNNKFKTLGAVGKKQWNLDTFKTGVRGVQWMLWKKDDVAKVRAQIRSHSDAVHTLLATIQVRQANEQSKQHALSEQRSIEQKLLTEELGAKVSQLGFGQCQNGRVTVEQNKVSKDINRNTRRTVELQELLMHNMKAGQADVKDQMRIILENQQQTSIAQENALAQVITRSDALKSEVENLQIMDQSLAIGTTPFQQSLLQLLHESIQNQQRLLLHVQELQSACRINQNIPPQVLLSAPVVLLDALGRSAPFHLEPIDSSEALIAVLKIRFKEMGLHKIESGEFALEETRRKRQLELSRPWTSLVKPGQHISMSIVFQVDERPTTRCPGCGKINEGSDPDDIQCTDITCRLTYRRTVDLGSQEEALPSGRKRDLQSSGTNSGRAITDIASVEDEIMNYTRVLLLIHDTDRMEDSYYWTYAISETSEGDEMLDLEYSGVASTSIPSTLPSRSEKLQDQLDGPIDSPPVNDQMARYEIATHTETMEMLTGLRHRDRERSQRISIGDARKQSSQREELPNPQTNIFSSDGHQRRERANATQKTRISFGGHKYDWV